MFLQSTILFFVILICLRLVNLEVKINYIQSDIREMRE